MISIIIVSLNTKNDFLNTINSVISQNEKIELIVIDGKSVDGTLDEIKKYNKFLDKIIIEKDDGIYSAMNKGIKLATKKWIYFLNSGDVFYSNKTLKSTIEILKKNENFDVIIGNSIVKKKNRLTKSPRKKLNNNTVNSCFSHQSTFTKTELLKKYSFDTEYKFASDFDFFLKLFYSKKKFLYIDELISINKSGGTSDINRLEVYSEFKKIIFSQNKNLINIFKINFLIFFNLAKKILKLILPNYIIDKIIFYFDKKIR
jgi:glycosyltransferase involved in cell wall biosynthesis